MIIFDGPSLDVVLREVQGAFDTQDKKTIIRRIREMEAIAAKNLQPSLCRFVRDYCLNYWRIQDLEAAGFNGISFHNWPRMQNDGRDAAKDACGWDATARDARGVSRHFQFKAAFEPGFRTVTFGMRELEDPGFKYLLHYRMEECQPVTAFLLEWEPIQEVLWGDWLAGKFELYAQSGAERHFGLLHMRHSAIGPFFFVDELDVLGRFAPHVKFSRGTP